MLSQIFIELYLLIKINDTHYQEGNSFSNPKVL